MQKLLNSSTEFDSRANLFYYFYLFEAMQQTGVGNFTQELQPWQDIVAMGMSATPEKRIEQHPRSEVHPWTAHPVHFYFSLVAGIRPTSPGFKTVNIAPQPGSLKTVRAAYPTKQGAINVDLQFTEEEVVGSVILPPGMSGMFSWQEQQIELLTGKSDIRLIY